MSPPSFPQGQGNGNLERAQLMQTGESGDESFAFLSGNNVGSSDYLQGPGGLGGMTGNEGAMMPSPFQQLQNGDSGSIGPSLSGGGPSGSPGGLFNQYTSGAEPGSSFGQTDVNPFEANRATQYNGGGMDSDRYVGSSYGYSQPFNRNYQNQSNFSPWRWSGGRVPTRTFRRSTTCTCRRRRGQPPPAIRHERFRKSTHRIPISSRWIFRRVRTTWSGRVTAWRSISGEAYRGGCIARSIERGA